MGFVNDDHIMVGQHINVQHGVDRQQRVVGDYHIHVAGLAPRQFRKTGIPEWAAAGTNALFGAHRHLPPGQVGHPGFQAVSVAGFGFVRPFVDAGHVPAQPAELRFIHQRGLCAACVAVGVTTVGVVGLQRRGLRHLVLAQVVLPTLHDGEAGFMIQQWFQRVGQAGQVPIHQLPL